MATMFIHVGSVSSDSATSSSRVGHILCDPLTLKIIHCHIVINNNFRNSNLTNNRDHHVWCVLERLESVCHCYDIFRKRARFSTPITQYRQVNVTKLGQYFFLSVYFFTYFFVVFGNRRLKKDVHPNKNVITFMVIMLLWYLIRAH